MLIVGSYTAYLAISLCVTVWVARTLQVSGRTFLIDAFRGNAELADSVNRLLVVGFYLINVGFIARVLRTTDQISTARGAIELVSDKIGLILVVLGIMHFLNIYIFNRLRKRAEADSRPPFPADARIRVTES